ncbi:MAG: agmatinase [Maribacter sp.]|nr:agmatinase [Maribacter sp.]
MLRIFRKMVLQGILYDDKSSYLKGPALAPPLIRKAYNSPSANYFSESGLEIHPGLWDDKGDFAIGDYFEIEQITAKNIRSNIPLVTLGGDHSITYPIVRAFHNVYGPFDILHIDAHADLYNEFEGDTYSHACPFARIMENHLAGRLVQVGLRTLSSHQRDQAAKFGVEMLEMKDFDSSLLPRFKNPIYVSLDIDVLDPAFAPGVSHHEPGGLSTRELIGLLQSLEVPILGADIVEYNPKHDINQMTAMVGAKLLKEIAALIIRNGK